MTDTMSAPTGGQPASDDVRKARLAQAVEQEVTAGGRVEAQDDFNATIRCRKPTSHVRPLIIALGAVGLWSIVTLIMHLGNRLLKYTVPGHAYGKRFRGGVAYRVLHLILTLVTLGLWRIVYRVRHEQTIALTVSEFGDVVRQPVV